MKKRKMMVVFLAAFAALATPALAQERERRPSTARQSAVRQPSQPQVSRSVIRSAVPRVIVTRSRGYGYGSYGRGYSYGRYGYEHYPAGLKFHLELVPKNEHELVKRGIVLVNGAEIGIVNRHDGWWNRSVPVPPGDHEVTVELEDGRVFQTRVVVCPGQVLHVYLRFPSPESEVP